jgi:hypothetical protein
MPTTRELLVPLAVALVVVILFVLARRKTRQNRAPERQSARGPANLNFICAGCEEQFTHTKRTLGAWHKGTRKFFCNACHTKWRTSHPTQPVQGTASARAVAQPPRAAQASESPPSLGSRIHSPSSYPSPRARAGSGCLGAALLILAIPVAVVFLVVQYA